jgi:hypothetical protein
MQVSSKLEQVGGIDLYNPAHFQGRRVNRHDELG